MSDRTKFGHDTTTDEVLEAIDLTGKTALITGGSSGLGAETARALASKGAHVTITARQIAKAQSVADQIKANTGNPHIDVEELELGSLTSVRAFAKRFLDQHDHLDLLINNAGVMACPYGKTEDGFEIQFGTCHLGHFLMTVLLTPALIAASSARVVTLSSGAHIFGPVNFDDPNFENRDYEKWASYAQAKTANALFAVGLDNRLKDKGVRAFSVHPGVIETELGRHMNDTDRALLAAAGATRQKTIPAGAATSVYAATAPELAGQGGHYLSDCGIAPVIEPGTASEGVCNYAVDPEGAENLWILSEKMVGETLANQL